MIFTQEATEAFSALKMQLSSVATLKHFKTDKSAKLVLKTDASQYAVGAVLQQMIGNETHTLSFFSRKLQPAQTRYSTFGRELLAIYLAVKHF